MEDSNENLAFLMNSVSSSYARNVCRSLLTQPISEENCNLDVFCNPQL